MIERSSRKWKSSKIRLTPYDLPLLFFLLSAILGLWPAYTPQQGYVTLAALTCGVMLYFLISRLYGHPRALDGLMAAFMTLCGLFSMYFITQAGNLNYEDKVEPIARIARLISSAMPNLAFWKPMSNSAGTFLEGSLFLAIGLAVQTRKSTLRWIYFATAALMSMALIFSSSRGAWLAVLGAGLIWAAFHWKPALYLFIAACAGLIGLILFTAIHHDINVLNQIPVINSVVGPLFIRPDRLEVYRNSLALIADVPFTGIGLGDPFALVYSRYELMIQVPFLYYSHNIFLEVWLEQGLLGISSWLWLAAAVLGALWAYRGHLQHWAAEATWVGLLAVFLHGVSDARPYQDLWCWLPFFVLLGLNGAFLLRSAPLPKSSKPFFLPAALVGVFLIACVVQFSPLKTALRANLASLAQQRADLTPSLASAQRTALLQKAADGFHEVLLQDPQNRTANQRLGLIAFDASDYQFAIRYLEAAAQKDPLHPGTRKALGLSYAFNQDFDQAVPLLTGVPNIIDELNTWGWFFATNNHKPTGLNAYQMSLRLSPNQAAIEDKINELKSEVVH